MHKYLLILFLFIPHLLAAQRPVKPVISKDYLQLIKNDTLGKAGAKVDSLKTWRLRWPHNQKLPVRKISFRGDQFKIKELTKRYIDFMGTFTSSIALRKANQTPALQNEYSQGRSLGGVPVWRGPETNEMFSYGPLIGSLAFDGTSYPYDTKGKLIPVGSSNGQPAVAYDNQVLQESYLNNQMLTLRIAQRTDYQNNWHFSVDAGTNSERTIIINNRNAAHHLKTYFETTMHKLTITGGYAIFKSQFANDNRGGFLNRVYQNSLLSPISFESKQGIELTPTVQRRFATDVDNPLYLLNDNGHYAKKSQHTGNLSAKIKVNDFTFGASSSLERIDQNSNESLKPGTAFFDQGYPLLRQMDDWRLAFDGYASLAIVYPTSAFKSTAKVDYHGNHAQTDIGYQPGQQGYNYERRVNEFAFVYRTSYDQNGIRAGVNVGNKTYQSSTFTKGAYFLPNVDGFFQFKNPISSYRLPVKLAASYTEFYTEPSPNSSYAYYALTRLTPDQAFSYMPVIEASGFNMLQPVKHNEFTTKLEIGEGYPVQFVASYFVRNLKNEIFPVYEGTNIMLKNLADTRYRGIELEFNHRTEWSSHFNFNQALSFSTFKNVVKNISAGRNYTPVAGFSNIHKALVQGEQVGVIVGNDYVKTAAGQMLIGSDGYPVASNDLTVIGNPVPDFTMKLSQGIWFNQFLSLTIDWEYNKGGDIWNGTRAQLDYYGRSEGSASERSTVGYVFPGTNAGGQPNTVPVTFYDPSQPIELAKWVRYGATGVASNYIEKGDAVRIRNLSASYLIRLKRVAQKIILTAYAKNLILWSAYKGVDPEQLMYDQLNAQGLDFFNLPSTKTFGLNVSVQF